jgi:hypothetical protein
MSVGFSSALDDLQRRLAGSETHAAMVVTLDFDGTPLDVVSGPHAAKPAQPPHSRNPLARLSRRRVAE